MMASLKHKEEADWETEVLPLTSLRQHIVRLTFSLIVCFNSIFFNYKTKFSEEPVFLQPVENVLTCFSRHFRFYDINIWNESLIQLYRVCLF